MHLNMRVFFFSAQNPIVSDHLSSCCCTDVYRFVYNIVAKQLYLQYIYVHDYKRRQN